MEWDVTWELTRSHMLLEVLGHHMRLDFVYLLAIIVSETSARVKPASVTTGVPKADVVHWWWIPSLSL